MTKSFKEALKARRTFYRIQNKSTLSDKEIRDLICFAFEFFPSAFNSQTTRVVLLTGKAEPRDNHRAISVFDLVGYCVL